MAAAFPPPFAGMDVAAIRRAVAAHKGVRTQRERTLDHALQAWEDAGGALAEDRANKAWDAFQQKTKLLDIAFTLLATEDPDAHDDWLQQIEDNNRIFEASEERYNQVLVAVRGARQAAQPDPGRKTRIRPDLKPEILTKDATPMEARRWARMLRNYLERSGLDQDPFTCQHEELYKCVDESIEYSIQRQVTPDTPIFGDRNAVPPTRGVVDLIEDFMAETYPLVSRRVDLFRSCRDNNGGFVEFCNKVESLAKECDVEDFRLNDIMVFIIIAGVQDDGFRREAQKDENVTWERIRAQASRYDRAKAESALDEKVKTVKGPGGQKKSKPPPKQKSKGVPVDLTGRCRRCAAKNHTEKECQWDTQVECNHCKKKGHIKRACQKPSQPSGQRDTASAQANKVEEKDEEQANMVRSSGQLPFIDA